MKQAIFICAVLGLVVSGFMGFVTLIKAGNAQWDRNEQAFRTQCEAVNGRAVWNNKHWECLK